MNTRSLRLVEFGSGTTVCVCDPQSVMTDLTWSGLLGSETSKIRMPSQPIGEFELWQLELDWRESTDWNISSRSPFPYTPMSACGPLHGKLTSSFGSFGLAMSRMRKPP